MNKWNQRFIDLAKHIASWSKDPSTQCGCVIVDDKRRVLGIGFNGFPRGVYEDEFTYQNREFKYLRVVHAEENAIYNCSLRPEGGILYVYTSSGWPICNECAKTIIQSGIKHVVMPDRCGTPERAQISCEVALEMFTQAGVIVTEY